MDKTGVWKIPEEGVNIAAVLTPKNRVIFLYSDCTVEDALEAMRAGGFSAVPVITRDGSYVGTVCEGDFLWYLEDGGLRGASLRSMRFIKNNPPIEIASPAEELQRGIINHNFLPVCDSRGSFIGIVTRRDVMRTLLQKKDGTD